MTSGGNRNPRNAERSIAGIGTERRGLIPPPSPAGATVRQCNSPVESINRDLDDTLWLRRAHSLGHQRQLVNLLGYALMVNGLALRHHRQRPPAALAA